MSSLDSFFAAITLTTISEVAGALIASLNDEDPSAHRLNTIIGKDPALSANWLRAATSAQFGLSCSVSTLDDAIALVGLARVRALAVSACLTAAFPALAGLGM